MLFDAFELRAHRGLGEVQAGGGASQAARLGDGEDQFQMPYVQTHGWIVRLPRAAGTEVLSPNAIGLRNGTVVDNCGPSGAYPANCLLPRLRFR